MRQGPDYGMNVVHPEQGLKRIFIPIELHEEFENVISVNWHDNGDGTYIITPTYTYKPHLGVDKYVW